jgi:hypothetical protein
MKTPKIKGGNKIAIMPQIPKLSQRVMIGKFTTFGGYKDLRTL